MTLKLRIVLATFVALLAGCGGGLIVFGHVVREGNGTSGTKPDSTTVAQPQGSAPTSSQSAATPAGAATATPRAWVKEVTLSIEPKAAERVAADSRFDADALRGAIEAELRSRRLLDSAEAQDTSTTVTISIENYDLHADTNFAIFGSTPYTGALEGTLVRRDERGETSAVSRIEAHAALSVPADGEAKNLLAPLYRQFAVAVADTLTGRHTPPNAERQLPPPD